MAGEMMVQIDVERSRHRLLPLFRREVQLYSDPKRMQHREGLLQLTSGLASFELYNEAETRPGCEGKVRLCHAKVLSRPLDDLSYLLCRVFDSHDLFPYGNITRSTVPNQE